jgi:ABC-type sugar transport system ATPase subunit
MGLDRWKQGQIILRGKQVSIKSVKTALDLGIRWLPQDRKLDGLMMQMSVLENGTISDLVPVSWLGLITRQRERQAAMSAFTALSLKAASIDLPVSALSGGNQQKVLLTRCLLGNPDLIFLDDATRGIDVGAKEDIYQLIEQLASQGKAILMVSSELPELLRCCDRVLVMREGTVAGQLEAGRTTQNEILTLATRAPAQVGGHA